MRNASQLLREIRQGEYDRIFARIYGGEGNSLNRQRVRYADAVSAFQKHYGAERMVALYSVPGRVELCGNHTDHNNGVVLAAAVDLDVLAVASPSDKGNICVRSKGFRKRSNISLARLEPQDAETGRSQAMIRGVAACFPAYEGKIGGFDAYVASDVLRGSGLSSSAAFEICIAAILNGLYNDDRLAPVELALIAQRAENVYFGKPSGLMDQLACAAGGIVAIDLENPAKPVLTKLSLDLSAQEFQLVITNTKGNHAKLTHEYAAIRTEMEEVARLFGKRSLREVDRADFFARIADVRERTGDRAVLRSIHFFEECRRVERAVEAIRAEDLPRFLRVILESGHSSFEYNQNAYCAGRPREQGVPVALALSQSVLNGLGAWRLQGGGFAGTIQAFVPDALLDPYCRVMRGAFGDDACHILRFRKQGPLDVTKLRSDEERN